MAKRKPKRRRPDSAPTFEYRDDEGNVLALRGDLSPATIRKLKAERGRAAASADDLWRRRNEMLFERLVVRWEISGLPLEDQKMLIGRYRIADSETQRWVRETISDHVARHITDLDP